MAHLELQPGVCGEAAQTCPPHSSLPSSLGVPQALLGSRGPFAFRTLRSWQAAARGYLGHRTGHVLESAAQVGALPCLELPSYSYQRRRQTGNVKCSSHGEEDSWDLVWRENQFEHLIKVSLACHLLTQKAYYYYRKAKQRPVKSLFASVDGQRLRSVAELLTSSQKAAKAALFAYFSS